MRLVAVAGLLFAMAATAAAQALPPSDALADRPLLQIETDRTASRLASQIDRSLNAGRVADAAIAAEVLAGTFGDRLVGDGGLAVPVRVWLRGRLTAEPALAVAMRPTGLRRMREVADGPLTVERLLDAEIWTAAGGESIATEIVGRLRDAGRPALATRLSRRWGLTDATEPDDLDRFFGADVGTEPARRRWELPVLEHWDALTRELRIYGMSPRLTRRPVMSGDALVVRLPDRIACLDPVTLTSRWESPIARDGSGEKLSPSEVLQEAVAESIFGTPAVDGSRERHPGVRYVTPATERVEITSTVGPSAVFHSKLMTALVCLDRGTGDVRWRYEPNGCIVLSPGVRVDDTVWTVIHSPESIDAVELQAGDGSVRRTVRLASNQISGVSVDQSRQIAAMIVGGDRVVVALNEGLLAAIDPTTATIDWARLVESEVRRLQQMSTASQGLIPRAVFLEGTVLVDGDRVVAAGPEWREVVVVDLATGRLRRSIRSDGILELLPATAAGGPWLVRSDEIVDLDRSRRVEINGQLREGGAAGDAGLVFPTTAGLQVVTPSNAEAVTIPAVATGRELAGLPPRSTTVVGETVFVQTVAGLVKQPLFAGDSRSGVIPDRLLSRAPEPPNKTVSDPEMVDAGSWVRQQRPVLREKLSPGPGPVTWPVSRPTIEEGRSARTVPQQTPIAVQTLPGEPPSPISVYVLRGGGAISISGPRLRTRVRHLPSNRSVNRRVDRRHDRAWLRGRNILVQVGSELMAYELVPKVSGTDGTPSWLVLSLWTRPVDTFPSTARYLPLPLQTADAIDPFGRFEQVNAFRQSMDNVVVTERTVILRQAGHLLAVDLRTAEVLWRRFDLSVEDRVLPSEQPNRVVVADRRTARWLDAATGRLLRTESDTWRPRVIEAVGRGPFVCLDVSDERDGRTRAVAPARYDQDAWTRPLPPTALSGSSEFEAAIFDRRDQRLTVFDRAGDVWVDTTVPIEIEPDRGKLIVSSVPDGVLVGLGTDADPAEIPTHQPGNGFVRESLSGRWLFFARPRAGTAPPVATPVWSSDVAGISYSVVQPASVPVLVVAYRANRNRNPQSDQMVFRLIDRRTGQTLLSRIEVDRLFPYHQLEGDIDAEQFTLRLKNWKEIDFRFSSVPETPERLLDPALPPLGTTD